MLRLVRGGDPNSSRVQLARLALANVREGHKGGERSLMKVAAGGRLNWVQKRNNVGKKQN